MQDTRIDPRLAGLIHPNGEPIRLNKQTFVAVDRQRDAQYQANYRPQIMTFTPTTRPSCC